MFRVILGQSPMVLWYLPPLPGVLQAHPTVSLALPHLAWCVVSAPWLILCSLTHFPSWQKYSPRVSDSPQIEAPNFIIDILILTHGVFD